MVEGICYGKLLLQPQTISIDPFKNISTNDIIPKSLYGTVIVAVFCSSTSEALLAADVLNKSFSLPAEILASVLINLGLISLYQESPIAEDIVSNALLQISVVIKFLF